MIKDLDDMVFGDVTSIYQLNREETTMSVKKPVGKTTRAKKPVKPGMGLDVGTGFLVGAGFDGASKPNFTPLRDAFFTIDKSTFNRQMFDKNKMKYVEMGSFINVVGEDALTLAKLQNTVAKRPLSSGVVNPQERNAAPILKEMIKFCVNKYKNDLGKKLVFSVPGPKIGEEGFNVEYHSMSIGSLIQSIGLEPIPLNEAYAVMISELDKSDEVTGLGFSFGAGLVNVCFVYKSMLLFEFSIDKSGDYIDRESAKVCGQGETAMSHIKEKDLDLMADEFAVSLEQRALIFTYRSVIRNVLQEVVRAFTQSDKVNVIEPVPVIVSGGTSLPKGFMELFQSECDNSSLPFEITKIIPAKDRLAAVARGCLLHCNYLEGEDK